MGSAMLAHIPRGYEWTGTWDNNLKLLVVTGIIQELLNSYVLLTLPILGLHALSTAC